MKINLTYSLDQKFIPDFYYEILGYYGLAAKNIKNSSIFIIQNLLSSYNYHKDLDLYILKNNLHSNQVKIIDFINQAIGKINNKKKNKTKKDNDNITPIKQFKLYTQEIDKNTYYQIINKSVLENTIKIKEINSENKDYSIVHSHLAQSVLQKVCDDFNHYYKALSLYCKNKDDFTGKPKQPDYKPKTSTISFDISIQRFTNGGMIRVLKNHTIYKDYYKKIPISKDLIENFNSFDLLSAIHKDIENKGLCGKVVSIRIIPGKYNTKPKIEYVLSYEKELKGFYPDLLAKSIQEKDKDFFKLKDKQKLNLIRDYFNHNYVQNNPNNPVPYFMGLDLGIVNFAVVSIFNEHRDLNYIVSGRILNKKIGNIDSKIDRTKSELIPPEIKAIQSKKDKKEQLSREELKQLKSFYKELSINSKLVNYQCRKNDITTDFIHKLSKAIIEDCLNKGIKVIIVGKNKGWKNEVNMGSKNNRAMYNFPHARFIEKLKYKAMLKDILVIETEESYTSKTSFIDGEILAEYSPVLKITTQDIKNQLSGKRVNQVFITKNGVRLHADLNGSFNIGRKILKHFVYNRNQVTLSYELIELKLSGKKKFTNFYKNSNIAA